MKTMSASKMPLKGDRVLGAEHGHSSYNKVWVLEENPLYFPADPFAEETPSAMFKAPKNDDGIQGYTNHVILLNQHINNQQ